jgi:homoserine O-succinyltransferase
MSRVEQFLLGGGRNRDAIHVGLVNNMPDEAMRATELQFARLLKEAAGPLDVRLRLFSLRTIPRSDEARSRMSGFYDDAGFLQAANIDALIITGADTSGGDMRQEPFWQELTQLIDWAELSTISTIFSGRAAHAAALHLDGIAARPLAEKLSGIYDSFRVEDDALFFNTAPSVPVPHAREADIIQSDLAAKGYRLLSRLANGQADIFTREQPGQSRFIFLQGHPEHDPATPGREYLRELGRFVRGESTGLPALPENYFDRATESRLAEIGAEGEVGLARAREIIANALPRQTWRPNTIRLFGYWLTLIAASKARRTASRAVHTRRRAS